MSSQNCCPLCEEGRLHEQQGKNAVEYSGCHAELDLLFSVCDVCGAEQATSKQTRCNKRAMVAFKKEVDGLLIGKQVCALRKRLKLTQAQAARIFGGGAVAFSKYESNDVMQSEAMDKLLRVADSIPEAFIWLAARAGIDSCEPEWEATITDITSSTMYDGERRLRLVHSRDWNEKRYA